MRDARPPRPGDRARRAPARRSDCAGDVSITEFKDRFGVVRRFICKGEIYRFKHARLTNSRWENQPRTPTDPTVQGESVGAIRMAGFRGSGNKHFPGTSRNAVNRPDGAGIVAACERHEQPDNRNQSKQMSITAVQTDGQATNESTTSARIPDGPLCGCLGCSDEAAAVIDHDDHGKRTVCADHIDGHEVIERV